MKAMMSLLVLAVVVVSLLVAQQPRELRVERTMTLDAPASVVFAKVNNLAAWEDWSPWAKLDPAMVNTYEGPAAGTGAKQHWKGNQDVGEGRMTITESRPDAQILIHLEFVKPFASESISEFVFTPDGDRTEVTWRMVGENDLMARLVSVFMDIEGMIGTRYEAGLSNLNQLVHAQP
ncbi:MAG TPA: SRPBCC family protein [Kiritimatiellia bacterium]|nr:SRPBCC family protein [Kiritimatiellia bacterium]HMP34092.1 SRPBCC family protein [Kiritimatiellia bacterium]